VKGESKGITIIQNARRRRLILQECTESI